MNVLKAYLLALAVDLRWFVRGVDEHDYRKTCARCGRTGQTHWSLAGCVRFKAAPSASPDNVNLN